MHGVENEVKSTKMANGIEAMRTKFAESVATVKIGTKMARKMRHKYKMSFFFRRLDIIKVHRATYNTIEVSYRFHGDLSKDCNMCGHGLKLEISRATGIGPVCAKYLGVPRKNLDDAKKTLEMLEKIVDQFGIKRDVFFVKYMKGEEGMTVRELHNAGLEVVREEQRKAREEREKARKEAMEAAKAAGEEVTHTIRVKPWLQKKNGLPEEFSVLSTIRETEKAVRLQTEKGAVWVPKSAITEGTWPEAEKKNTTNFTKLAAGEVLLKKWYAQSKGVSPVISTYGIEYQTAKAILFRLENTTMWVPRSAIVARK